MWRVVRSDISKSESFTGGCRIIHTLNCWTIYCDLPRENIPGVPFWGSLMRAQNPVETGDPQSVAATLGWIAHCRGQMPVCRLLHFPLHGMNSTLHTGLISSQVPAAQSPHVVHIHSMGRKRVCFSSTGYSREERATCCWSTGDDTDTSLARRVDQWDIQWMHSFLSQWVGQPQTVLFYFCA